VVSAAPSGPRFRGLFPGPASLSPPCSLADGVGRRGYYLYREGAALVPNQPGIAYRHGNSVQWLQEHLHLDFELSVNRFVSGIPG
jgi:hypothetical protein